MGSLAERHKHRDMPRGWNDHEPEKKPQKTLDDFKQKKKISFCHKCEGITIDIKGAVGIIRCSRCGEFK